MTTKSKRKLEIVTARLFSENVEELRRRAATTGIPWQVQLRALVDDAVRGSRRRVIS